MPNGIEIIEENLSFRFPEGWFAQKFDVGGGFAAGLSYPELCKVDIVAVGNGVLWLIEAKDYRSNPFTHARRRRKKGKPPLEQEFVAKVRDTVAILVAARRQNDVGLSRFGDHLMHTDRLAVNAVLVVERDVGWGQTMKGYSSSQNMPGYIRPRLRALGIKTDVTNRHALGERQPPWRVESRPMQPGA
jgi:hypothetical protein